jgi:signal transduction histidine kinase
MVKLFASQSRSVIVIFAGFAAVLVLLALLFALRLSKVSKDADRLETLRVEYLKKELVFQMRDAAHTRAIILLQITRTLDPAKQQALLASLNAIAKNFIEARDQLLAMELQPAQRAAWDRARPLTMAGRKAQDSAAALLLAGQGEAAGKLLQDEVIPIQNQVMQELTNMLDFSTQRVNTLLDEERLEEPRKRRLAIMLASITLLIGICIAFFVIRTIARTEAALVRAREEAQEANRHKTVFLANMSHELRTPLTAILGYSELLCDEAGERGLDDMVTDLQTVNAAGKHLLGLINDILDLAKVEAGKIVLQIDEFSVTALVEDIATTISPLLGKNRNTLKLLCNGDVGQMHTDANKVRQILLNLLSNATKFTADGQITLTAARETRDDQDWLTFRVTDTGIGMNSEQMSRLFQAFSQGDASTTRKYGGTGLGLAISKRFCKLMGGDLTAASEAGVGSTFTVKLPAFAPGTQLSSPPQPSRVVNQ